MKVLFSIILAAALGYFLGSTIYANRDVSFSVEKGELAIILGSSGARKSTVLNILGGMDTNDSGKVIIDGKDISKYTRNQLTAYRRTDVGFVFQFYNLVQNLTAKENVELASEIVDNALDPVTVLKDVGLADRMILKQPVPMIKGRSAQSPDKFFYQINSFSAMPAMLVAMSYKPHLIIYLYL